MRAKNEFRKIAASYNTKLILERVVDGKLMCPEACCGSPVMECKCGPDCPHCNCHEIQKLAGKDKTIKEFYKMRDPDGDGSWPDDEDDRRDHPDYGEPEYQDTDGEYGEDEERVRLTLDSPGTASMHLPKGDPRIQKYLDKGYKIVKDYKKATQSEDNEDSIIPEDERDEPVRARRGITGYEHKPDALVAARQAGAKHKPYVSSFVSDGGKIFGVMGSDGKIVHKTRDKQKAYKWFRDNYENI